MRNVIALMFVMLRHGVIPTMLVATAGCSAFGPVQKNKPAKTARAVEDEDAGVQNLTRLLRTFNHALEAKDFDGAGARLREIDTTMQGVSDITRGHPDFEEIEARVARARPQLDEAVEKDRIERRNAAIAELIRRGNQLGERGKVLLTELAKRVPTNEDMENLKDLINELTAIEKEGGDFLEDQRYREHATQRDRMMSVIIGRRRQAEWQIQTSGAVGTTINQAVEAVGTAKAATNPQEQIVALQRAAEAFATCVNAIRDAESLGGYEPTSVVTTRLGTLAITETKKRCQETEGKIRLQAARLAYHERVSAAAKRVDAALTAANKAVNAQEKLVATEAAVEALSLCQTEIQAAQRGPGHDGAITFDSVLGTKINGDKLLRGCERERTKLAATLPAWRWRQGFETMKEGLAVIKQRVDEASGPGDAGAQIQRWQKVIENLGSCVSKARAMARERNADSRYTFVTVFGDLNVAGVEKYCEAQRKLAEGRLAQAIEAQSIETFAATCKGDEVAVARREGVPTQVVPVEGGRVFLYGKKGSNQKSFGFDASGKVVDFAEKWREQITSINGELVRVNNEAKSSKGATALLTVTTAALPVLEVCVESLTGTERHPGFDSKARFTTPLGKVTATELRAACQKRRTELAAGMPKLKWKAQLEQVRDRAQGASAQVEDARGNADTAKRVQAAGAALGGYRECVERAESMARAPEADKRASVSSPFGAVNVSGLAKACQAAITKTEAVLALALAAQKLERFLGTCKGDELEVAKREGMPDRIDGVGTGRIFVYEAKGKKGKKRKLAFDANGARVEEATLSR